MAECGAAMRPGPDAGSWSALLQRHVLIKLSHVLGELVINPADQQLAPLEAVLAWVEPRVERTILGVPQPTALPSWGWLS